MSIRRTIVNSIIKRNFKRLVTLDIGAALEPTFEFGLMSEKSIRVDGRENSIQLDSQTDVEEVTFISDQHIETFYELKKPTCSSLLQPNFEFLRQYPRSDRFDINKQYEVKTKTLESIIRQNPSLQGVKIDVQGAELKVLKSAGELINRIEFFEIETSFRPMYKNGATFSDVYDYLINNGFFLLDMRKQYWSDSRFSVSGDLIWCDCLFVNSRISNNTNNVLSLVYGYLHRVNRQALDSTSNFLFKCLKGLVFINNLFNRSYIFTSPLSNCS